MSVASLERSGNGERGRWMAEGEFRLPGSSYEELSNIIVAYGTRDEASNPGDVGKLNAVHQSSFSRNNAFLAGIGILQGEREKLVTRRGRALAISLSRKDQKGIQRGWRQIISTNEFLQNVLSAVKLREGMMRPTLQAYIAHVARQPRNNPVMTGANAIIDMLKAAGLLEEDAGELNATFDVDSDLYAPVGDLPEADTTEAVASTTITTGTTPVLNIHLHVRCDPDEIEDLAPKLRVLLREVSNFS